MPGIAISSTTLTRSQAVASCLTPPSGVTWRHWSRCHFL